MLRLLGVAALLLLAPPHPALRRRLVAPGLLLLLGVALMLMFRPAGGVVGTVVFIEAILALVELPWALSLVEIHIFSPRKVAHGTLN